MDLPFRIEKRDRFRVVGYSLHTTNQKGEGRKAIPQQWEKCKTEEWEKSLLPLADKEPFGLLGVSIYNTDETDARKFEYLIGVASDRDADASMSAYMVPAMMWAIFPCTIESMGKTQAQAITKWLPKSNYKALNKGYLTGRMKSGAPDMECYGSGGNTEIWIGVEQK